MQTDSVTLNIHGTSLEGAWMTSEAKTELTENSSSLKENEEVISLIGAV